MELLLVGAAFVGTVVIVLVVGMLTSMGSRRTSARLRELAQTPTSPRTSRLTPEAGREDAAPTLTRLLGGYRLTEKLYVELAAAGLPIRPSEFAAIVAGCVILSQLLAALLVKSVLAYVLLAVVAASIPIVVLKSLQHKRRAAFDAQIVDAILMMASSLRSGFSFLRGMQMVANEMPPPISVEFGRVISEVNVGRPMEDALRSVVARVSSYDFDLVVTAVLIQHQVGGNLADILETIANTIRERVRVLGEMRALTAEGRISGVVLVILPIIMAVALALLNPKYMSILIKETIGHYLIGIAIVMQVIGGLIIKKMLVIDI